MISVRRVTWEQVRDELQETFAGDEQEIKADVLAGRAECWRVGNVALIARKDGSEFVMMCLAGNELKSVMPVLMKAAKRAGCRTARFHTARPALGRHLQEFGFKQVDVIFRADL